MARGRSMSASVAFSALEMTHRNSLSACNPFLDEIISTGPFGNLSLHSQSDESEGTSHFLLPPLLLLGVFFPLPWKGQLNWICNGFSAMAHPLREGHYGSRSTPRWVPPHELRGQKCISCRAAAAAAPVGPAHITAPFLHVSLLTSCNLICLLPFRRKHWL